MFESPLRKYHTNKKYRLVAVLFIGGLEEIRTPDPHNANVVRSQLRYKPGYGKIINRTRKVCQGKCSLVPLFEYHHRPMQKPSAKAEGFAWHILRFLYNATLSAGALHSLNSWIIH